jgi:hypothetical protein
MLQSYEATYENGQITWVDDRPSMQSARLIVTVLEEIPLATKRRVRPTHLAGQVKILGDIVSPIVDEEDWECLK